ncbi:hypothetical protein RCOM_0759620 [Ricinus communis]|uniref:Uncharacterized protein n=1 Tax=Ricinus communis TaxID=3988 RepID=B9SKD8_RICCO|nr:hypothetical protein RCOM_0759620 [Ricinus communis]
MTSYGCRNCESYLHKSCMDMLPETIQVFLRPCQLVLLSIPSFLCDACVKEYSGLSFRCGKCYFELCVGCYLFSIAIKAEDEHITHFSHRHPLRLFEKIEEGEAFCSICSTICLTFAYGCRNVAFTSTGLAWTFYLKRFNSTFIHAPSFLSQLHLINVMLAVMIILECTSVVELVVLNSVECSTRHRTSSDENDKGWVQHFSHHHPLILSENMDDYREVSCVICGKIASESVYHLRACEKIQHFLHEHPFIVSEKKVVEVCCNICGTPCLGLTYGCSRCKLYLHESCAKLPQKIKNFSHLAHPLILASHIPKEGRRVMKPTIEYPGHSHRLTIVDKIHDKLECNFCKTCCKNSPAFHCLECNFSLHLLCGPLLCTIKHECHIDTLTLKDQPVEDDDDDDEGFYYDACERQRDPRLCVYYCALGCPMIVDVKCIISEVLASLRGKHGNVELRIVVRNITSKVVIMSKDLAVEAMEQNEIDKIVRKSDIQSKAHQSLDEILISLNAVERRQLDDIEATVQREVETTMVSLESKDDTNTFAYYSEESLKRFMERLSSSILETEIPDFILEHDKFINFQDYLVPLTLIPTFQDLLGRNEDICDGSTLSTLRRKSLIFYFLRGGIENMRAIRIMDLTDKKPRRVVCMSEMAYPFCCAISQDPVISAAKAAAEDAKFYVFDLLVTDGYLSGCC